MQGNVLPDYSKYPLDLLQKSKNLTTETQRHGDSKEFSQCFRVSVVQKVLRISGLATYARGPLFTVILVVGMAALVTSVIEEAGFRGYFSE